MLPRRSRDVSTISIFIASSLLEWEALKPVSVSVAA
jgi:hypothetical protein